MKAFAFGDAGRVFDFPQVGSTQEVARTVFAGGQRAPFIVTASRQNAGRGQHGRVWHDAPGSFAATYVVDRRAVRAAKVEQPRAADTAAPDGLLPLAAAVAVMRWIDSVVSERGGAPPAIADQVMVKWPNDIVLRHRKVGGVLIEIHQTVILIGIGLNLRGAPMAVAADSAGLQHVIGEMDRLRAVRGIALALENTLGELVQNRAAIVQQWLSRAWCLRDSVQIITAEGVYGGSFRGIDNHGGLQLMPQRAHQTSDQHSNENDGLRVFYSGTLRRASDA